ncbi:hypothetical protein MM1S1540310_3007 [Mycobacteroides abscessus subsp. bolletii 1S-154-0310]|uniref:hypothetical protein n=1 Tax=Mycobacteroides abscessus TaxID=36809 RepID=UPI00026826DD|nr:hypothetical protein [Mycobacteroides abscessus]WJJ55689.1 tapemeasure protein [Mycobacterium phage prophiT48-1]WJJ55875.1 tapemeasure protein [Mycobacterium phage prophiT36-1]EIU63111.1 hypothetical protein MM1S1510930_3450 [Mycobacteroides abscessus subsp. bolletii 1S-151-0930]EIU70832.1 hypothetical protein MM1S1520914_3656 [Mycobacteroides abscessus subsp. bolletii 1S-152-0914]EIU73690.1 hypothetical protein MM1S1530915_2999 [Mycobacteroides abscessus subsp. bolletii 1S-153-0915]
MTTPVGSIRLDLSIDGSNLDDEITAAVQKHMGPAMARLQAQLDRIEREYVEAARAAEKSSAKQTAAARAVAEAVEDIGDEHTKSAAKARAGESVSTRSINATTRAIQKQTAAWEANAAARIAAAAAPTPAGPPPGGGSRGGGGGGSGGGVRWHGGRGGFLSSPMGLNAISLGVGSLPAATTAVVNLTGALQQLVQVGFVVPGVIGGMVSSIGTAVLGFHGLSDAVKASWEAAKSGDPKDIKKAAEAMQGLAPAVQGVVKAIVSARPQLEHLQRDIVAQNMFEGVDQSITELTDKSIPTLEKGLGGISKAWNATFKELGRVGGLDSSQSILDKLFGNTADAQNRANAAIEPLIHGFGTLTAEGSDFLPRIADGLTAVTKRFDNWITRSVENGNLDKWITEGIEGADHLGNTLLNIGKIIASITKAAGGDGGLLSALDGGSGALADFLASDKGQEKLIKFFTEGREQIKQWMPILGNVASLLGDVYDGMKQWTAVLLPILKMVTDLLNSMPGGISGVVTAFLAWRTISGITSVLSGVNSIGSALDGLPGKAGTAAGGINKALAGLGIGAAAFQIGGGLINSDSGLAQAGGFAANIGGGALAGGLMGGPWGAALGAMIGAGVSLFELSRKRLEEGKAEWDKSWQEHHDNPPPPVISPSGIDLKTMLPVDRGPSLSQGMLAQIQAGKLPGYSIGPNGAVIGPEGQPLPGVNLGGVTPYTPSFPLPTLPPPALPPQKQPTTFLPIPGATGQNVPAPQGTNLGQLIGAGALPEVQANVQKLASDIQALPEGEVKIKDPSPEVMKNLESLDVQITKVSENEIQVKANTSAAQAQVEAFILKYKQQTITMMIQAQGMTPAVPPGRADGGVLPGWSPGVDNMLVPMSGGEGVLIPEAVRGLGGAAAIYAINSRFRSGLSRRGYADGGVVGAVAGIPGVDDNTELGVLRQIRDLLAGKGGGPLPATSDAIKSIASDGVASATGNSPARMGPFGTPIKARNPGYEAAAAAIQALGGDPAKWIGEDPSTYLPRGIGGIGGVGAGGYAQYAALLSKFAKSGKLTAELVGAGLDANDPVIRAITTARNKKRGALGDDAIAALVEQIIGGGGYTGSLNSSNSALISSLQTFRDKLGRTAVPNGTAIAALPAGGGPKGSKSGLQPNANQLWDFIATNFPEVREIGGVRQDAISDHPSGRALDIMVGQNKELGDRINAALRANYIALGLDSTIWRDKWEDFNGNSSTVAGHQDHIHAKVAAGAATGMPGLPMPGGAPGLAGMGSGVVPVYVTNFDGQMRGMGDQMLGALSQSGGLAASNVAGDMMSAVAGLGQEPWNKKNANYTELNQLVKERNPLALAKAMGLNVEDFTRAGGDAGELTTNDGKAFDASGRMFSDTGALLDRTFTSVNAQLNAMREQLVDVIEQTNAKLNEEALEPVVKAGVQSALESLKDSVSGQIGTALGQAAAPPIADAVRSAIPADGGGGGAAAGIGGNIAGALFATGGPVYGGIPGKDSVPALLMPNEHVLTTDDVARMGGHAGVYAFRAALARHGGVRGFATGGGVNVNDTVGAEFFGVSQIPILGAIVNLLVRVLLRVLGVEIEARDTLNEMTDEFRQFRGDFEAFDASGRLMNDTSALVDRSSTSEEEAAQERIRILKIVIEALIKYIIEKVIVPIAKAVANAAIQAGASAAGAAVNTQAPGAGGIVSALISSGGQAGVDIIAEIGSQLAVEAAGVIIDMLGEGLQSYFPDIVNAIFGGGLLENLIAAPITAALEIPLAIIGALSGGLTGLFAPLLAILGGGSFDRGGLARGVGMMPKATIRPERVLSPQQTILFERMIAALERNPGGASGNPTYVTAQINVEGGPRAGENVRAGLLELMS